MALLPTVVTLNLSLSTHPRETLLRCILRGCHLRYELLRFVDTKLKKIQTIQSKG